MGCVDDDDEYMKLVRGMNPPRVVIDNDSCDNATVIRVDSVRKHGTLLQVVQVLTDLNLIITKAYITSDGSWFMDVFNVTNHDGSKVTDEKVLSYIESTLESDSTLQASSRSSVGVVPSKEYTSIELTGTDRPGLLSEVCAVLADLKCNVVSAEVWTHKTRAAAVVHVTDEATGLPIEDPKRLSTINKLLCNLLRGNNDDSSAKMFVSVGLTHTERRLHQLMFNDRDFDRIGAGNEKQPGPEVVVMDCAERDYTVIIVRCRDRPKLLFDTICTLTDMHYVVFHGTVSSGSKEAYQEYYIRHVDGLPVSSEAERQRVIQCLEAAIERRTSEGLEFELRTEDRAGLLSDITRVFRENGLSIKRAEISTRGGKVINSFYVSEMSGNTVEAKVVESIQKQIGQPILRVKQEEPLALLNPPEGLISATGYLFGSFFKGCSFHSFRLILSCSYFPRGSLEQPYCKCPDAHSC